MRGPGGPAWLRSFGQVTHQQILARFSVGAVLLRGKSHRLDDLRDWRFPLQQRALHSLPAAASIHQPSAHIVDRRRFAPKGGSSDLAAAMTERRYSEEEVAAIFERAAEAQQTARRQLPSGEGMMLSDLQEIGREVGIPPELVAQAARSMDQGGLPASRTFLGLPIGVGRTVDLDRRISEEEWERLVVDLRETFDARGSVRNDGSFRQWTNGNLQALLEPTATGHRLRLRTVKGDARGLMTAGLASLGVAAALLIGSAVTGQLGGAFPGAGFLSAIGLSMFGIGALRLPGWARLRRRQMEGVAARLALAAKAQRPDDPPTHET